jgi:signal transduction histidine kinase
MFHRLQFRLLFPLLTVALAAVAIVTALSNLDTQQQIQPGLDRDVIIALSRVANLVRKPASSENWRRVQDLLQELSANYQTNAVLYGGDGRIMAASDPTRVGEMVSGIPLPQEGYAVYLSNENGDTRMVEFLNDTAPVTDPLSQEPALMTTLPLPPTFATNIQASQHAFFWFVNRSLLFLIGIAVALVVAAALSWFTTRRILQPVDGLMEATQQMRRGNLTYRVQIKSQDELGQLGQAFNEMAGDLARQEQLRRNLVNDVAHELLTPLATIRGYLEAIQDGVMEPSSEVIGSVHAESLLLDHLVADLQELALAEAGQLPLNRRPVSLPAMIEQAVAAVRPEANEKGLHVEVNLAADLAKVDADPQRIGQVLRNLLRNAIQHTPAGGEIEVMAVCQEDEVQVSIHDTGEGITPEHLPHIFDRFYRADPSRARTTGGTGLGLAIVKGVVEAHGGHVWVESTLSKGTTFSLVLPATG